MIIDVLTQKTMALLKTIVNHALSQEVTAQKHLQALDQAILEIHCSSFHKTLQCKIHHLAHEPVEFQFGSIFSPTVIVRGTWMQLLRVLLSSDKQSLLLTNAISLEGDAEIGQQFMALFSLIDWENCLSHIIGDIPTHYLMMCTKHTHRNLHEARQSLTEDIREYIHEEARWLPTQKALETWFNAVDILRLDVDRAQSKINLLKIKLNKQ